MILSLTDRRALSRLTAALVACLALGGLWLQLHVGVLDRPGRTLSVEAWRMARYFTVLTNLLVALAFIRFALVGPSRDAWAAGLALWIAIVGVVYHALLARELSGLRQVADMIQHTAVPAAVLAWWLVFAPKAGLVPRHALFWLVWPALYVAYALIRGEIDGRHPYFFIDPPRIGWGQVWLWIAGMGAAFWLAGLGLVALGRTLSRGPLRPEDAAPADPPPR